MASGFSFLARHRWASVALAILTQTAILVPLGYADPAGVVGVPAAVTAAIAGSVAVVLGPREGGLVAFTGAAAFGAVGGWGAGEVVALVLWPAIVVAAGLFGRRVERQRQAFEEVVAVQESERQRLALELHDGTAQLLAASLFALGRREGPASGDDAGNTDEASRALILETLEHVRSLAVDLRPKVLDDYGLVPALERLASTYSERTGIAVGVTTDAAGQERLPPQVEITAYRAVEQLLALIAAHDGGGAVTLAVERAAARVRILVEHARPGGPAPDATAWMPDLTGLRERVRLVGGRLSARAEAGRTSIRVTLPAEPARASAAPPY